jgi:hypothetical protein
MGGNPQLSNNGCNLTAGQKPIGSIVTLVQSTMMSRKTLNRKRTALRQAIRRFLVGEEGTGAALVEFTVLTPMLVIMSIYTMDYGLLFYYKLELQNSAQAGAQWAMANRVYNQPVGAAILRLSKSRRRMPQNFRQATSTSLRVNDDTEARRSLNLPPRSHCSCC